MSKSPGPLPIAIKRADRDVLHAAAARLEKPDSTFTREAALAVAREVLKVPEDREP